jgi:hypothetical protein
MEAGGKSDVEAHGLSLLAESGQSEQQTDDGLNTEIATKGHYAAGPVSHERKSIKRAQEDPPRSICCRGWRMDDYLRECRQKKTLLTGFGCSLGGASSLSPIALGRPYARKHGSVESSIADHVQYTYWDYFRNALERNFCWRIDHILATAPLATDAELQTWIWRLAWRLGHPTILLSGPSSVRNKREPELPSGSRDRSIRSNH